MSKAAKLTIDRIMLAIWMALMIVNVISHFVVQYFGGIIMVSVYWAFAVYFNIIYGEKKATNIKYDNRFLLAFTILFFIEMQLLLKNSVAYGYTSMGVTFNMNVWQLLMGIIPTIVSCMGIVRRSCPELTKWRGNVLKYLLLFISVTTLFILRTNPLASKITAMGHEDSYIPFLAGYGMIYALALVVPVLLARLGKENNKLFWGIIVVSVIASVFFASFFLAILAMIVGVGCFFLLRIKNGFLRIGSITAMISIIAYILFTGKIVDILLDLAEIVPLEQIQLRLRETAQTMTDGSTEGTAIRFELYSNMIKQIAKHPITGNIIWNSRASFSGHSTNLDMWSGCGLIVFGMYFLYFWRAHKINMRFCVEQTEKAAAISTFISFLFISTFNPILSAPQVYMIALIAIPAFCSDNGDEIMKYTKEDKCSKYIRTKRLHYASRYKYKSNKER